MITEKFLEELGKQMERMDRWTYLYREGATDHVITINICAINAADVAKLFMEHHNEGDRLLFVVSNIYGVWEYDPNSPTFLQKVMGYNMPNIRECSE